MFFNHRRKHAIALLMTVIMVLLNVPLHGAWAGMISTEDAMALTPDGTPRTRLAGLMDRQDVQTALRAYGIDPQEASARIQSLSDAEVARLVHQFDHLPAGGDALGTVVGALLILFLVLLFTDIIGWTNVYPFVRH